MNNSFPAVFRCAILIVGMAFFWSPSSTTAASDEGIPVDPAKLEAIQQALEHYLSGIQTLRITFDCEIAPTLGGTKFRQRVDMLCRFDDGSCRVFSTVPGNPVTERIEKFFTPEKSVSLNVSRKEAGVRHDYALSPALQQIPLQAVGLPLHGTRHTRLSSFLKYPAVTRDYGEQTLHGERAILLKVGPGLPDSVVEGEPDRRDTWFKVWVAPEKSCLPVRLEKHVRIKHPDFIPVARKEGIKVIFAPDSSGADSAYSVMTFDVLENRSVSDRARNREVPFPWRVTMTSGVTARVTLTAAEVNPGAPKTAFQTRVPDDFGLSVDGEIKRVRLRKRSGKSDAVRVEETGRKAREILSGDLPEASRPASTWSGWVWPVIGVFSVALVIVLLILRERRSNV